MKTMTAALLLALAPALSAAPQAGAARAGSTTGERIEALLQEMTLEEKVGQMTQLTLSMLSATKGTPVQAHTIDRGKLEDAIVRRNVGSILNTFDVAFTPDHWADVITEVQDAATKRTRLGIPVLYGVDAVHGANYTQGATLFPQNIGLAATWSPDIAREAARITARDVRASGIPWNFSPVLDLGRQPLWSRFFETFGEDVLLASAMGRAVVQGYEGGDVGAPERVAACMKHFVGYSFPLSGKDRTPAWIPDRMLREYFLPTFQAAIDAGAHSVMVNSGEVNGEPVHASRRLLTDVLRGEMGFQGVVVTDWADVAKLRDMHRVAGSYEEATKLAVDAGIDLCMTPESYEFYDALLHLAETEQIPETRLDASVRRILALKLELGLFERPYPDPSLARHVGSAEGSAASLAAARESITLLRNERNTLPFRNGERLLVTGPGADSLTMQHGSWTYTWQGDDDAAYPAGVPTVLDALRDRAGDELVSYVQGCTIDSTENSPTGVEAAVRAAEGVDAIVAVIGERPSTEKPGDIDDLALAPAQVALVQALQATGKPVVLVLLENRPRIVRDLVEGSAAILTAYQPGPHGGTAVAEILFGDVNPSGKLPFTYPRASGALVPYDHKESDRHDRTFGTNAFQPQFEFGHGLSYTEFSYSSLTVDPPVLRPGSTVTVAVDVRNSGERPGKEVVQLYVRDEVASITPPVKRLRGFQKILLAPGESRRVSFELAPDELSFVGLEGEWIVEPGAFQAQVGPLRAAFHYAED